MPQNVIQLLADLRTYLQVRHECFHINRGWCSSRDCAMHLCRLVLLPGDLVPHHLPAQWLLHSIAGTCVMTT